MARLAGTPGNRIRRQSSWYLTAPVGLEDPEWFINGVILLETNREPLEILADILQIEQSLGRRRVGKWGPRTIDLDILLYDDRIIRQPELTVPHPEMGKRRFVLEPLAEIAPDLIHPVLNRTIEDLRRSLTGKAQDLKKWFET